MTRKSLLSLSLTLTLNLSLSTEILMENDPRKLETAADLSSITSLKKLSFLKKRDGHKK